MKRVLYIIFLMILLCIPLTRTHASCDFNEQYKLSIIGSNIDYVYDYVKNTSVFDVKFYNVRSEVYLEYNEKRYNASNGEVTFKNIDGSKDNVVKIYASKNTSCNGEYINEIPIKLPIYNKYYTSSECENNSYHRYCARFLDSGIDINKVEMEVEDNTDNEVDEYLKNRKDEKIVVKIKTTVKDIFTKKNIILMVLIILLVLIIVALIKKFREITKLKF